MKLYGFDISNYCNMVKMALLEKGCDFEFIETYPTGEPELLQKSPMGKLPFIETEAGCISETGPILEFLEESQGGAALLPADSFERARVREMAKVIELYLELPARACYGACYFGGDPVDDAGKEQLKTALDKGVNALKNRARFEPYLAGDTLTLADVYFHYTFDLAADVAEKVLGMDLWTHLPGSRELFDRINQRESARQIAGDREAGWVTYRKLFS